MPNWSKNMLLSEILDNYKKKYPIYDLINFSSEGIVTEHLHPLFIITQYIIDEFIKKGDNRIAIVLPDDECSIIPMLLAKYFSNILSEPEYAGSILDEIEKGQHIRLGKAVAEFLGFLDDEEKRRLGIKNDAKYIKFKTGKANPVVLTCLVNGIHYMFEKTNGAISSSDTWDKAFNEAQKKFARDNVIKDLRAKRASLSKTICLLSAKNDFKEFVSNIDINGTNFDDMVAYGEINLDSSEKFRLYNRGKLDCLPAIAVTAKIEEISDLLKIEDVKDKVFAIFSTIDKFDGLMNDLDTLKNILRQSIPFVAFVSESDFEKCPVLTDYGFELWHWKPSTMKSKAFRMINDENSESYSQQQGKSVKEFETLSASICNKIEKYVESISKSLVDLGKWGEILELDANYIDFRPFIQQVCNLRNKLIGLTYPVENTIKNEIENEFLEINRFWNDQKPFCIKNPYISQDFISQTDEILVYFRNFWDANKNKNSLFGKFAEKIKKAALSNFEIKIPVNNDLRKTLKLISLLSKQAYNCNSDLRYFIRKIWDFQNKLTFLICPIEYIKGKISEEFTEICEFWKKQKCFYAGQPLESTIEDILRHFGSILNIGKTTKLLKIETFLSEINTSQKKIRILIPNKYPYFNETSTYINSSYENNSVKIQTLADFYTEQEQTYSSVDYLIVTWFDKDEYIHIKQSYCYTNLVFVLYDYENRWREGYMRKFDLCIPHETIKQTANRMSFSEENIQDKPLDRIIVEDNPEFEEISDYNISNTIIRLTLANTEVEQDSADAIECIPIILSEDKIAYFYPTHDVIDVTALSKGDIERPVKKEARKLRKGDKILVRQSGKDIIKEKADFLMSLKGENSLRDKAEIWSKLLSDYASNKMIIDVFKNLKKGGAECTSQQIRYWLSGDTIMPRNKDILIALGVVASQEVRLKKSSDLYLKDIDAIFEAGKKIQAYHQNAGRLLTSELKSKASEIKAIANKSISRGNIEGIGDVSIYTVEDILSKELVSKGRINRLEDLY